MTHSFCLIAAALLAGQTPDGRVAPVPAGAEPTTIISSSPGWTTAPVTYQAPRERRGLFPRLRERIRSWFVDDNEPIAAPSGTIRGGVIMQSAPSAGAVNRISPTPVGQGVPARTGIVEEQEVYPSENEPPLAGPTGARPTLGTPVPVHGPSAAPASNGTTPGLPGDNVMGHDELYRSLVGRLELQSVDGGMWVLRYAASHEDRYSGAMALSTVADMREFHAGQLAAVTGEVLADRPAAGSGLAIFRVQTITPVEVGH